MKKNCEKMLAMLSVCCLLLSLAACATDPGTSSPAEESENTGAFSTTSSAFSEETGEPTDPTDQMETMDATDSTTDKETKAPSSSGTKKPTATTATTKKGTTTTTKQTTTTSFKPTTPKPTVTGGEMLDLAFSAYQDLLNNWWTGNAQTGHLIATNGGLPSDKQGFLWEHAMAIFALDSLYKATGSKELYNRIVSEWNFIRKSYPNYDAYVTVPEYFHYAQDDAGWNAMLYMLVYEYTGDTFALDAAGELIHNTYEFWKNGDLSNGLLYGHDPLDKTDRHSATHVASTMLAAFEYLKYREDEKLKQDTITLYNWTEETMLRDGEYEYTLYNGTKQTGFCDDMLYWFGINMGRTVGSIYQGPEGAETPNRMDEANSTDDPLYYS